MAKVLGPDFIALQVSDMAASQRFYVEQLGLEPADRSPPGAVVFKTTGIPFAIREPMVPLAAANKLGWGVSLWIGVQGADDLHRTLADAGVTIVLPPADGPFGRFFAIQDPDGYTLTLHEAA
jgi:predicted enzyme related to lactoylglutathione lyase